MIMVKDPRSLNGVLSDQQPVRRHHLGRGIRHPRQFGPVALGVPCRACRTARASATVSTNPSTAAVPTSPERASSTPWLPSSPSPCCCCIPSTWAERAPWSKTPSAPSSRVASARETSGERPARSKWVMPSRRNWKRCLRSQHEKQERKNRKPPQKREETK